jgi:uncharacterized coiled-coil protein SlyX
MNESIQLTITIPSVRDSLSPATVGRGSLLIPLVLVCLALSPAPKAFGVTPAPDGGYPNGNTAEGDNALLNLTTGTNNTAIGFNALAGNTTGFQNTATGFEALLNNTTGGGNTANGLHALFSNTTGGANTANGSGALRSNTTGGANTANGLHALFSNTNGNFNTADGEGALGSNTTGNFNTANGLDALFGNTNGNDNTANGVGALEFNRNGSFNTANGGGALQFNNASNNTANGFEALFNNASGSNNTAEGFQALLNAAGSSNIAMGFNAGINLTTGNSNIDIGNSGVAGEGRTIRIGTVGTHTNTFIAGIHGVTVASAVGVVVDVNGHLGTVTSSARFKDEIKPMDKASEAILALQPVTFRYKHELDPEGIPQFGLVAEQVEKVNPDLVVRDADGKINTVRYEAVNAMLLNEFLKEHRKVELQDRREQEQEATIAAMRSAFAKQETTIARQQQQIEGLTATVQKVSDRLELNKPAPQLVADNQ